jgi:ribonuclease Z
MKLSRRHFLQVMGLGAAAAGLSGCSSNLKPQPTPTSQTADHEGQCYTPIANQMFDSLPTQCPSGPLAEGEMRISFLGTSCIPRLSQEGVSVYVEVGPTHTDPATGANIPLDYAMFDCGMGVLANYIAMNIPYSRMDKIFIAHLHMDHMSDLSAIYAFGEASDRKSPLYVWGSAPSGVPDPVTGQLYDDGVTGILTHFREWARWHTESFSFASNSYKSYTASTQADWNTPGPLVPVGPKYQTDAQGKQTGSSYADPYGMTPDGKGGTYATYDSYALVPIELDWTKAGGVAYWNKATGLKITHFPAIHTRKGAMSYKVEWTPPGRSETLSMIYSGDTKPNYTMISQAQGIDVLVHEIVMPPDEWASHMLGIPLNQVTPQETAYFQTIQASSHTSQGAFGYLLSQMKPLPRLTILTHFQAQDDTIASAQASLDAYKIPRDAYLFAADLMMLNVTKDKLTPSRADVSHYAFSAPTLQHSDDNEPKYHDASGNSDPNAQIDNTDWIPYTNHNNNGVTTYNENGY